MLLGFAHVLINNAGATRNFFKGHSFIQVSFHAHFMLDGPCGIDDWEIILIDKFRKHETG